MKQKRTVNQKAVRIFAVLLSAAGLFLTATLAACSSDNDENLTEFTEFVEFPASYNKVPVQLVDEGKIPNWLIEIVKQYSSGDAAVVKTYIYSGVWEGQTVYLVHHPLMSSFYYHLYESSGTRLEYGDNMSVIEKTQSWKCIYIK